MTRCGQEVLERSACTIEEENGNVIVRFEAGFPANGRTINAKELIKILFDFLPKCVEDALIYDHLNEDVIEHIMHLSENQQYIREKLKEQGLLAFVADGSILPRVRCVSKADERRREVCIAGIYESDNESALWR